MNRSVSSAQGAGRSISDLSQAVLDALPEGAVLNRGSQQRNAAIEYGSAPWAPADVQGDGSWKVEQLLPELNLGAMLEREQGFLLCRAVEPGTDVRREVVLHVYPMDQETSAGLREGEVQSASAEHATQFVLGLRLVNSAHQAEETVVGDAFHDAFHDPLTRLANRRLFHRRLDRMVERAGRTSFCFAVLFVDLDRFKSVNDQFGHTLGDKILISAARRLVDAVRPQDMVRAGRR